MGWVTNEMILYVGVIFGSLSLLFALASGFVFKIKKINLNARLDAEFGKQKKRPVKKSQK